MFVATRYLPDPHDPCKGPARRWQRSGYLLDHRHTPLRQDDTLTHQAWHFAHALAQCHTDADREQLTKDHPALAAAHAFSITAEPLRRAELEARLLAGGDDRTSAGKLGLSPAAVAAYHDLFFEVRPHLNAHAYVLGVVLGGKPFTALKPDDREAILKTLGYQLGDAAVDDLLDFRANPPAVPATLEGLDLPAQKRLGRRLRVKLTVLQLTTPASAARPATWQRLGEQHAAAMRASQSGDEGAVLAATRGLLDVITGLSTVGRPNAAEAVA